METVLESYVTTPSSQSVISLMSYSSFLILLPLSLDSHYSISRATETNFYLVFFDPQYYSPNDVDVT